MRRVTVEKTGGHLLIKVGWRSGYLLPLGGTQLAVGLCYILGTSAATSIGWTSSVNEFVSAVGFLVNSLLLLSVGYGVTAYWINSSVVDVSTEQIFVRSEPFPFPYPRRRALQTSDVVQLSVERTVTVDACMESASVGSVCRFDLCALVQGGDRILLLNFLAEDGEKIARFIEEEVERYLGIADEHVEGEHQ